MLFGTLFFGQTNLFSNPINPSTQEVMAQTIGKILSSQWEISIWNNWRSLETKTIIAGDEIVVENNSVIKVLINESVTTEVVWPARFRIVPVTNPDGKNSYNLEFNKWWDYIAINTTNPQKNTQISIKTPKWLVIKNTQNSNSITELMSFTVVDASSSEIAKVFTNNNTIVQVVWSGSEVVSGQFIISNISQLDLPSSLIPEKNIPTNISSTPGIIAPQNTLSGADDIKKSLSKDQIQGINNSLYKYFIESEVNNISYYYLIWNESALSISISNLSNRLDRIAHILEIPDQKFSENTNWLIKHIDVILKHIQDKYDPASLWLSTKNLIVARERLRLIDNYKFANYKEMEYTTWSNNPISFEELISIIWINLKSKYKFK